MTTSTTTTSTTTKQNPFLNPETTHEELTKIFTAPGGELEALRMVMDACQQKAEEAAGYETLAQVDEATEQIGELITILENFLHDTYHFCSYYATMLEYGTHRMTAEECGGREPDHIGSVEELYQVILGARESAEALPFEPD